jgi:hypothetical protein
MTISGKPYSMRRAFALLPLIAALGMTAGCRKQQIQFELNPAVVSSCKQPVAVRVDWDVAALGLKQVRVEVNNIGRQPKLWFVGGSSGSEQSGAWAHDGFTVTLKAMNGVELGRRTMITTPCPGKDWL